ncbi:winged helix-turn-helix domain-containing protein [Aequitasia blattaphilus]|uniref:Stage 0 sporulation protein A homolog n=1 Tax=Aequitasia blattaphilus TaxID=2949332 RepID=A0ABT1E8J2_9FIRM|nr:response regulator transcription factor [Aequitasia blattaphilus]MCP1101949.1 response regulator transcription factor [Aequitasia blattaphilus]MCR8614589.1 response regulator transcription factor [Aequitasia blattaphilus]
MIYCVEDDDNIRELVVYTLESTGFQGKGFGEGASFYDGIKKEKPDLILLDIMLPKEDGLSILKKLKSNRDTKNIPVIMLTAKSTEYDKVLGLDLGADDYIAKPFGMMELVSRVKAVLRRGAPVEKSSETLVFDTLVMNQKKHEVKSEGESIPLTFKEYELLKRLMTHPNQVLTRDQLLEEIWGYDFDGETRTVDVHVRTLRQKLGKNADKIETVRGVGYRISD